MPSDPVSNRVLQAILYYPILSIRHRPTGEVFTSDSLSRSAWMELSPEKSVTQRPGPRSRQKVTQRPGQLTLPGSRHSLPPWKRYSDASFVIFATNPVTM